MPNVWENDALYTHYKVSTVSGVPLFVSGVASVSSGTITLSGGTTSVTGVVTVADNNGSLTVDGKAYRATVVFQRPNNATAYTAGDVLGISGGTEAIHTLSGVGPSGGFVILQSAALLFSDSSVPSGMAAFRVHFFMETPTGIADNAAFDLVSGDRSKYAGYIDLPTPIDLGSTIYTQVDYPGRVVKLASGVVNLFAEIETRGGYTPASGSTIELRTSFLEAGL